MATKSSSRPEKTVIGKTLEIPRMINGLWQLAGGHDEKVDVPSAAKAMDPLILAGLDCFDMADHYGDAELVVGCHHTSSSEKLTAFTKWCPAENGVKTFENAEKAIDLALSRLGQKSVALMQYHIWDYSNNTYLHNLSHLQKLQQAGKIQHIGLTNTDAAHLQLLIDSGFSIATNQVSCSVIDRRVVRGRLSAVCKQNDVGILAYGTLLGGYLSEQWLGKLEPTNMDSLNWSLRKYLRFIRAAGGWAAYQIVLQALDVVAKRHGVSIPAVATRFVLDLPPVKAVIVGTRLSAGSEKYTARNLEVFSFLLSKEDHATLAKAQESLQDVPGDCGDEYRRAPYLTASGDLSHHISEHGEGVEEIEEAAKSKRIEYFSGSPWEPVAGYCRAIRTGNTIRISGTTANSPVPSIPVIGGTSARSQTVAALDIMADALHALGGSLSDVVRIRIMVKNEEDAEEVSRAHGWAFGCVNVRPANTLVTAGLIGSEFLVEIEAEAELGFNGTLSIGG